ncbi:hypothetical protein ACI75Y_02325 [Capnocytophaga stomatis]
MFKGFKKKEEQAIAEIKKTLQDFIYNENICGDWKKVDGKNDKFDGKFGSYNLNYTEYQECTHGTFYKVSEEFRFYHTSFNLYDAYDQPGGFFYIYNPDTQKWVRFFPDFREFKRDPMPAEMRELLLTTMDYVIPVESGYILITGKNFEGEDRNRLIAGTSLLVEAGLSFTVVGKGFYKAGKGALKAGTNAIKNSKVTQKIIEVASEIFKKGKKIVGINRIENVIKSLKGAKGLIGKEFEIFLHKHLPDAQGSFSKMGRDFDGAYDNGKKWFEAKSGRYWEDQIISNSRGLEKFKSDMGSRLKIAIENGANYELFSNTPIPNNVKDWLKKQRN